MSSIVLDIDDSELWSAVKKIAAVAVVAGVLAAALGLAAMQYYAIGFAELPQLVIRAFGQAGGARIEALLERLSKQSFWSYFTDPYFIMSTGFIFLGFAIDALAHHLRSGSWKKGAFWRVFVKPSQSGRTDLFLFIYNRLSLYFIFVPLFGLLGPLFVYFLLTKLIHFNLLGFIDNGVAKFMIFLVVADFFHYVCHFVMHKNKALWEIHKFHHSTTEMNIITGTRDHPFEKAILKAFSAIPLAVLGAPTEQYFAIIVIQYALGVFIHSDWNISYGWFDKILISPRMHRIHHSVVLEHWDMNYGVIFSVWDRMFGTLYRGDNQQPVINVSNNYFNQKGFWYDVLMPMLLCYRRARAHFRGESLPGSEPAVDDDVLARQVA